MKVLAISDIHGRNTWEKLVNIALLRFFDKIVFMGDYVDSFHIKPVMILNNLKKIIECKKTHPDKIILLLGNHDAAYYYNYSGISGFNYQLRYDYNELLVNNIDLFDIAWGCHDRLKKYTLFTHAGLSYPFWINYIKKEYSKKTSLVNNQFPDMDWDKLELHEILNKFKEQGSIMFKVGNERGGAGCGSILWADKEEIKRDAYPGINQVIGHTQGHYVEIDNTNEDSTLYFIDVRESTEFLQLNF